MENSHGKTWDRRARESKAGQSAGGEGILESALPLAQAESGTVVWFALQFSANEFGIFDAFSDEAGRTAHLNGEIAKALMANAAELLAEPPSLEKVDILAAKL